MIPKLPPIFQISQSANPGFLHVVLNAASDMSFEVQIPKGGYTQLVEDLCAIAPVLMRVDIALRELDDNLWIREKTGEPTDADLKAVQEFTRKYIFQNCSVGINGFSQH